MHLTAVHVYVARDPKLAPCNGVGTEVAHLRLCFLAAIVMRLIILNILLHQISL